METQECYKKQLDFLHSFLPQKEYKFPGEIGLNRTSTLLNFLGNPQEKIKVIHVAGTSGKGSTCYILSSILINQGFKVGLSISPHLFDIRERTQINNNLISKELYCKYFEQIKTAIEETSKQLNSSPTYFEILTALNFYIFYKENVDYAIMETGLGGTYDATNVVKNKDKLSIITKIGLDHTQILGNTLSKIATQKAGIINNHSTTITLDQTDKVNQIFRKISRQKEAKIILLTKSNFKKEPLNKFSFTKGILSLTKVPLGLSGDYQIENASLAIVALQFLSHRDKFKIDKDKLVLSLRELHFPGRFSEIKIEKKVVIFDGAHNPQKMRAFIKSLEIKYPKQKFSFLVAYKHNKDYLQMLKMIIPIARNIVLSAFGKKKYETVPKSTEENILARELERLNYRNFSIKSNPQEALNTMIGKVDDLPIIVTGSLYLLSEFPNYLQ